MEGHDFGVRTFEDEIQSNKKSRNVRGIHIVLFMVGSRYFLASVFAKLSMQYGPLELSVTDTTRKCS